VSQVLYRKWRPAAFTDVVGQPTTTTTLQRAVAGNRVAHAYLFCGPRGTGKTSTARIFAKAVNCLSPQGGEPDNTCLICTSINEGRALDLIEIDAASNRGIDDIRNLRERVQYTPAEARRKIYIVDEAHMLTEQAFNALLKTLEEPPAHVAFVLATTEAHKIPPTISSRCQRFDFRRITLDDIAGRLAHICTGEGVEAEPAALQLIARAASGGLRDAVNLLEQAIVSYDPPVTEQNVRDLLNMGGDEASLTLATQILKGETGDALRTVNEVAAQGSDLRQLHRGVVDHLRSALLMSAGADIDPGYTDEAAAQVKALAAASEPRTIVRAIKQLTAADLRQDPSSTLPLELAIVEAGLAPAPVVESAQAPAAPAPSRAAPVRQQPAARPPAPVTPPSAPARPPAAQASPAPVTQAAPAPQASRPEQQAPQVDETHGPPQRPRTPDPQPVAEADLPSEPTGRLEAQWESLTSSLRFQKGDKFNLKALLMASNAREVSDDVVTLKFPHASHKERMQHELEVPTSRKLVLDAFARVMGKPYDVRVELTAGAETGARASAARNSPLVRAAQAMGAQVVSETAAEPNQNIPEDNSEISPEIKQDDGEVNA
jgi:DNA polymerase III subunit gamma/tau